MLSQSNAPITPLFTVTNAPICRISLIVHHSGKLHPTLCCFFMVWFAKTVFITYMPKCSISKVHIFMYENNIHLISNEIQTNKMRKWMKMYSVMCEWVSWKEPPFHHSQTDKCLLRYIYEKCNDLWNAFLQAHFSISPEKKKEKQRNKGGPSPWQLCNV